MILRALCTGRAMHSHLTSTENRDVDECTVQNLRNIIYHPAGNRPHHLHRKHWQAYAEQVVLSAWLATGHLLCLGESSLSCLPRPMTIKLAAASCSICFSIDLGLRPRKATWLAYCSYVQTWPELPASDVATSERAILHFSSKVGLTRATTFHESLHPISRSVCRPGYLGANNNAAGGGLLLTLPICLVHETYRPRFLCANHYFLAGPFLTAVLHGAQNGVANV